MDGGWGQAVRRARHLGFLIRIPGSLRKVSKLSYGISCSGVSNGQGRAHPPDAVNEDAGDDSKVYPSAYWGSPNGAGRLTSFSSSIIFFSCWCIC